MRLNSRMKNDFSIESIKESFSGYETEELFLTEGLKEYARKLSNYIRGGRKKFQFRCLKKGGKEFVFMAKDDKGRVETVQYTTGKVIDSNVFERDDNVDDYVKQVQSDGFRDVKQNKDTLKLAMRILIGLIGVGLIVGGNWIVLGPTVITVAGWAWDVIAFVGGRIADVGAGIADSASSVADFFKWFKGTGAGGAASSFVGDALKNVAIMTVSTIGGWVLISAVAPKDEKPQSKYSGVMESSVFDAYLESELEWLESISDKG